MNVSRIHRGEEIGQLLVKITLVVSSRRFTRDWEVKLKQARQFVELSATFW